jgi:hypothetical protein
MDAAPVAQPREQERLEVDRPASARKPAAARKRAAAKRSS